jgi:hypothetical protein
VLARRRDRSDGRLAPRTFELRQLRLELRALGLRQLLRH